MLVRPTLLAALLAILSQAVTSEATVVFDQGFETDTAGWFDENSGWAGTATRVVSGTGGVTSSSGGFHAVFAQTSTVAAGGISAPFSQFDGYRTVWPGGLVAEVDVFLDTSWGAGEGFDYSVAANGQDNAHQRDFIFHVTKDTSTGSLLVGGSNNTDFDPRENLEANNHVEVTSSGWYTLQHVFRDAGDGSLAVDLNLIDSVGSVLFTETRNSGSDVIATEIGGNRYGWFTNIDIANGIAVDNVSLSAVPEVGAVPFLAVGLATFIRRRNRRRDA